MFDFKSILPQNIYNYECFPEVLYNLREYNKVIKYKDNYYIIQHRDSHFQGYYLIPLQPYYDPLILEKYDIIKIQIFPPFLFNFPNAKLWPDRFDHIFDINKLASYNGSEFSDCRNEYNRFVKDNSNVRMEIISKDNLVDVYKVLLRWERSYTNTDKTWDEETDYDDTCFALPNKLYGFLTYINDVSVGYCISYFKGEYAVCPFFKCNKIYGLHGYIMKNFCIELDKLGYKWLNFTEDGGDQGMRTLKMKYRPVKFLQRYYIDTY